jgi:DMSO/TMAO reductase YedYZ heme-binding membrane subunit
MATAIRKFSIDIWASGSFPVLRTSRQTVLLWLLGFPALLPILFEMPGIVQALATGNGNTPHQSGNDVFGTGGALVLFAMLAITPLRTLTRRQWFVPLRRWYGIVLAFNIFLDAIIASNDTAFNGPVAAKLAIHSFLLLGVTMTLLLVPLCVMGIWNKWSMRQLGTYWKPIQKYGTYAVWGLLCVHLLLLEGFGVSHRDGVGPDSPVYSILHQRVYDFLGCSALLLVLRIPPVRRWVRVKQNAGKTWQVWLTLAPLVLLFLLAYGFFVNELMYKGIAAAQLNPIND